MSFISQGLGQNQPGCADGSIAGPGEVYIVQFLRPDGRRQVVMAEVGEELAEKAREYNLGLSAEWLPGGKVAIYGLTEEMDEDNEIVMLADNGPGENSPTKVLKRVIERLLSTYASS